MLKPLNSIFGYHLMESYMTDKRNVENTEFNICSKFLSNNTSNINFMVCGGTESFMLYEMVVIRIYFVVNVIFR